MAYFKSLSLALAFICFTSTVLSHYCHHDGECEGVKVCCAKGMCTYSWLCVWCKDDSDCSGGKKCSLHLSDDRSLCVSPPVTLAPPLTPFTRAKPSTMSEEHVHDENCSTDDDCLSSHVCRYGKCVHRQEDKNPVNRSPLILAASLIVIAILMIFILCSFFLHKRLKRVPHESHTEISRNARPAANTNHETNAALRAGDVFVDIPMEEVSPPLPADGPPPYNSLKFDWTLLFESRYNVLLGSSWFLIIVGLMIGTGGLIMIVCICGCYGIVKEHRYSLISFLILLTLIFIIECSIGVAAFVHRSYIEENLDKSALDRMNEYGTSDAVRDSFDDLQQRHMCCGSSSYSTWNNAAWKQMTENQNLSVPDSCCKTITPACGKRDHPSNIYHEGCILKLSEFFREHVFILGFIALVLSAVQLTGIILSSCMIRLVEY